MSGGITGEQEGMVKGNGRCLLIAAMILALLVLTTGFGCSRNKNATENSRVQEVQKTISDYEREEAAGSGPQEENECKQHWYYTNPGESSSVTFETLVDAATAKAISAEEPEFRKQELEEKGYSATYVSRSVDSFTKPAPIWIVSHPALGKREGKPTLQNLTIGDVRIACDGSGEGVIERVRGINGAGAIGQLSREELVKRLNGKNAIGFSDMDMKSYEVTPERKLVDQEFHILSVSLLIDGPTEVGPTERKAYGQLSWANKKIGFNVSYNRAKGKYGITGPATGRDCIKEPPE